MSVFLSSDWHLGHKSISRHRNLPSNQYHDQLIYGMVTPLTKRDTLWLLGDTLFPVSDPTDYINFFMSLKCDVNLVPGNHDDMAALIYITQNCPKITLSNGLVSYKEYWLSHCPIHPNEFRDRLLNIHGHLHQEILDDPRYVNVNPDVTNYKLVSLDDIRLIEHSTKGETSS